VSSAEATYRLIPPTVTDAINPIGCGDALTAGMAWAISRAPVIDEEIMLTAIRLGMAAATDRLRQLLPARLDAQKIEQLASGIEVERLAPNSPSPTAPRGYPGPG
jgi:fructose-1-phosphate kinase PfkB-like protein